MEKWQTDNRANLTCSDLITGKVGKYKPKRSWDIAPICSSIFMLQFQSPKVALLQILRSLFCKLSMLTPPTKQSNRTILENKAKAPFKTLSLETYVLFICFCPLLFGLSFSDSLLAFNWKERKSGCRLHSALSPQGCSAERLESSITSVLESLSSGCVRLRPTNPSATSTCHPSRPVLCAIPHGLPQGVFNPPNLALPWCWRQNVPKGELSCCHLCLCCSEHRSCLVLRIQAAAWLCAFWTALSGPATC